MVKMAAILHDLEQMRSMYNCKPEQIVILVSPEGYSRIMNDNPEVDWGYPTRQVLFGSPVAFDEMQSDDKIRYLSLSAYEDHLRMRKATP
jgi:hypothetical protein